MSVRITDLPEATELNGSELMPIVQNGVTRRTTLDFVNQAAPAALILQQTQQVLADTQQVLADTQQVKADTAQVLVNTEGVYNQTVMVQGQVEISIADWETQYLGAKSDPPTTDNEGNPLHIGTLYWDTSLNAMFVWSGTSWTAFSSAVASVNGQIGEVVLDYAGVGAANSGANDNITSMSGVTGDIGSAAGLQFNTLTPSATAVGKLTWNVEDSTLDLGMAGGVVQQIGQEMFYSVQNQTGFSINGGSVVRAVGTLNTTGRILVSPATADGVYSSHTFMGVATETIQDGDPGLVTFFGKVRDIDTTGAICGETWVDGDILYAHPEAAGGLTKVKPQAPNNIVMVALVIKAAVSGTLFVRTTYSSNLRDDELVRLNGLADGDVLQYDADLGRFENRTLSGAGIEPLGAATDSMVAHLAALDPHPQYTTPAEAAAAAPVQSVAGRTGAVSLTKADVGLANVDNTSDVDKPISTATQNALNLKLNSNDPSVTNAREWTAQTVSQVEAEAGTATTRRAWTAERVFQAIAAWWNASAFKTKLDGIQEGAQVNTVNSVAGKVGIVTLAKADVGLANVDNTSDLNKPVSTAQAAAIAASSNFQQAGTGAVVRTAQDKMREVVSVSDFGATGDGITDDTAAILAAITYAKTLSSPKLVVGAGVFKTSGTLLFDMPNGSHIEFVGTIVSNVTATSAVIIGSETGNLRGYHVTGIKVQRTTNDTAGGSIGVQIRNLVSSFIDVREVMGFQDGVFLFGTQANGGVSYNEIHLGLIHDNKRNVYLSASGAGYCNENTVFCGSLNHSSSYPAVATVNLEVAHFATAVLNNNRFFCPSFEDNSALAVAASINGDNNIIFHPRLENPAIQSTYPIRFETNARACALIGNGFSIIQTNIVDLGAETCVQTRSGMRYMSQTPAGAGNAVFAGRSIATSAARIFVTEDTSGNATSFGTGNGDWTVHSLLSNNGVLGYTAGAGGAVAQLTSKDTAVALNAPSGQITMHNASLAAGAKIEFLFNNTFITQQSLLVLSLQNSGAGLNYRVDVASTSAGNCAIRLTNLSGGALAEAVTINFAVINSSLS